MGIYLILTILVGMTAAVGIWVWKSAQKQEVSWQASVDGTLAVAENIDKLAKITKGMTVGVSTFQTMLSEHLALEDATPFAYVLSKVKTPFSIRKFIQGLQERGYSVDKVVRDIDHIYHTSVCLALTGSNGTKFIINVGDTYETDTVKDKEFLRIWGEEELHDGVWSSRTSMNPPRVFVDHTCAENCSIDDLIAFRDAANAAAFDLIEAPPIEGEVMVYHIQPDGPRGDYFSRSSMKTAPTNVEVFSSSYPGMLKAGGKEVALASAIQKIVANATKYPFKMVVSGPTGSGKTSFMKTVASKVHEVYKSEGKPLKVVIWDSSCKAVDPTALLRSESTVETPILLLVEDVQLFKPDHLSSLLNFMDGLQTPEGLQVVVGMNPKEASGINEEQLKALTRDGRTDLVVTLGELEKSTAEQLIDAIEKHHPELVKKTEEVAAMTYPASLAAIWSLFRRKNMVDIFN